MNVELEENERLSHDYPSFSSSFFKEIRKPETKIL